MVNNTSDDCPNRSVKHCFRLMNVVFERSCVTLTHLKAMLYRCESKSLIFSSSVSDLVRSSNFLNQK